MKSFLSEEEIEELCLDTFRDIGWHVLHGPDIGPDESTSERVSYRDVLLEELTRQAITKLNIGLTPAEIDQVLATLLRPESKDVMAESWRVYEMLTKGVPIERRLPSGETRHDLVKVIGFDDPGANDFVVLNQFRVEGDRDPRRPDIVAFVNGIPLAVFEVKVPGKESTGLRKAFDQLRTYAVDIPVLMASGVIQVVTTGVEARMGALGSAFEHFAPWKTVDGKKLADQTTMQQETLVYGVFEPSRFLDLVRNFVSFSLEDTKTVIRVAKYHQYHTVNKAIDTTLAAVERRDGRAGVVWHTQGSGKSVEMVFYTAKVMRSPAMENPTVVLLTDRTDLDDQLFEEHFSPCRTLPETPVRAEGRGDLRAKLSERASGGIIFSTIQKFGLTKAEREAGKSFPLLSERRNIVVIADEAHRTQYDLIDGLARHLRDGLPNAAFIGFTGTPIESGDHNTRQIFGDYVGIGDEVGIYDMSQSNDDGATVPIYYEARLARVELPEDVRAELDKFFEEATELAESDARERLKSRWARVEAIVGADERLTEVATDIVAHWEARRSVNVGKALIVCMSRRICVDLYDKIVTLRPEWHSAGDDQGIIKVVITGSADDGPELNAHVRSKDRLRKMKERAKDPSDPLELVIVRDMWLTGFDSPPLHTIYVDKPMRGAGLMQAITRVNRTFSEKPGGLVVDFIGIAENLRTALIDYTERDRIERHIGAPVEEALEVLEREHDTLCELLYGCPWREALESGSAKAKVEAILVAIDHLVTPREEDEDFAEYFLQHVRLAAQAFSLCVSVTESGRFVDDLAFFEAVAVQLRRERAGVRGDTGDTVELETALRQVVSDAVAAAGVIDIFQAAGMDRPDISLIDEEFSRRFASQPHPNLQIELLRRILSSELKSMGKRNIVASRRFSEMLEGAMKAYNNRTLTAAEVVAELVELAREMRAENDRGNRLGLAPDELALYDAICLNDSAVLEMGDDTLKTIARELVSLVRENATIDWDKKEQVRANMRRLIKRLLRKYKYPPDKQDSAVLLVMEQAEALAGEVAA